MQIAILSSTPADEYYFEEGCYITELSNSSADDQVSIARARLGPGEGTRLHALRDTHERYVILQGSGMVTVGERQQQVGAGDVVIIPEGTPQNIVAGGDEDLIFLAICSPPFTPAAYTDLDRRAD